MQAARAIPRAVARPGVRNMSGGGDMFKKKLDFAKDSVVPSSSYYVFAAGFGYAVYGLAYGERPEKKPKGILNQYKAKKAEYEGKIAEQEAIAKEIGNLHALKANLQNEIANAASPGVAALNKVRSSLAE